MRSDDDLDLSALLRPVPSPVDGPARARRSAGRRRVARRGSAGALAALVVVAGVAAIRSFDDSPSPTVVAGPVPSSPMLVVTRRADPQELFAELSGTVVDSATGSSREVKLPVPDDRDGLGLLSREGGIVMTSGGSAWVLPPPYTGPVRRLGSAVWVVPSLRPDSVWLVLEGRRADERTAATTGAAMEVDVEGRVVTPRVTFPCCRELVGESARGLVFRASDGRVEVWDVARAEAIASFDPVSGITDVSSDALLFSTNVDCSADASTAYVLDLVRGERRQLGEPCSSNGDTWSPDGRTVARWVPWDGAGSTLFLLDVDGDGAPLEVPSSTSAEYLLDWDPQGRVYFAGFYGGTVRSYDPATRTSKLVFRADRSSGIYGFAFGR